MVRGKAASNGRLLRPPLSVPERNPCGKHSDFSPHLPGFQQFGSGALTVAAPVQSPVRVYPTTCLLPATLKGEKALSFLQFAPSERIKHRGKMASEVSSLPHLRLQTCGRLPSCAQAPSSAIALCENLPLEMQVFSGYSFDRLAFQLYCAHSLSISCRLCLSTNPPEGAPLQERIPGL